MVLCRQDEVSSERVFVTDSAVTIAVNAQAGYDYQAGRSRRRFR